ncbi:Arabinose import ATP-binding protein AraG [Altererythrobacter insulae]|nr:Arabinose import ATP-binding protein AraG [Altererythrobacter insulae]
MSAETPIISLEAVACDLGGTRILDGVDLKLRQGEITVVLGPSGAGKSTLLRAIAGFEPISGGTITTPHGELSSATRTAPPEQRKIGFVVQSFALFPHLTAEDNVRFGLDKAAPANLPAEWLDRVKLSDRAHAYPHELSGGEQQRVALARALARDPDIVLLDEAFSSLDQQLRKSVRRDAKALLREAGAAVLAVTHDPDEAMELADRIVILDGGRVLQEGTPEELFWRPQSETCARLLGDVNTVSGRATDAGFETAFGTISGSGSAKNTPNAALIRPMAAYPVEDHTSDLYVEKTAFSAGQSEYVVRAENGQILRLSGAMRDSIEAGSKVRIEFDPARVGWAFSD